MLNSQIILADRIVAFDCDDTLVMWDDDYEINLDERPGSIKITNPNYTSPGPYSTHYHNPPCFHLIPHATHIRKLKGYKKSGWFVIIWSAGGSKWARNVAYELDLTDYADLIIGKPDICFDDQSIGTAFRERKYYMPKKVKND